MNILFTDQRLERMDREPAFNGDFQATVADEFRHRLQILRSATSEISLLSLKALDMRHLRAQTPSYRMRVTDAFGLVLELRDNEDSARIAVVTSMTPNVTQSKEN